MSASAPIRVRFRSADLVEHRAARLLDRRGLRGAVAGHVAPARGVAAGAPARLGPGRLAGGSPFVIVISRSVPLSGRPRDLPDMQRPSPPGEGPFGLRWRAPQWRPSLRVPPFSRREPVMRRAKKALKAGKERAKKIEEGYVLGMQVAQGHGDAAAIGRTTTATRLRLRPWKKSKRPGSS